MEKSETHDATRYLNAIIYQYAYGCPVYENNNKYFVGLK